MFWLFKSIPYCYYGWKLLNLSLIEHLLLFTFVGIYCLLLWVYYLNIFTIVIWSDVSDLVSWPYLNFIDAISI